MRSATVFDLQEREDEGAGYLRFMLVEGAWRAQRDLWLDVIQESD